NVSLGNFTVQQNAALNVAGNVGVQLQPGATLTDNGVVNLGAGDAVNFAYSYGATTQVLVGNGGTLTASSTAFAAATTRSNFTPVSVAAGGRLKASSSSFALNQLYLDNGSVLNAGDLAGDIFNQPLYLPASEVQYLSGANSSNLSFQDIDILAGTLASGQ